MAPRSGTTSTRRRWAPVARRRSSGRRLVAALAAIAGVAVVAGCGGEAAVDTSAPSASTGPVTTRASSATTGSTGTQPGTSSTTTPASATTAPDTAPIDTAVRPTSCLVSHHGPSQFGPTGLPSDAFAIDISGEGGWDGRAGPGTLHLDASGVVVTLTAKDASKGRIVHRATLDGDATANVRVEPTGPRSERVVMLSADTSQLRRSVSTTIDAAPAPTPPELQGLLDLVHGTLTVECAVGSGSMFASVVDESGFKTAWGIDR